MLKFLADVNVEKDIVELLRAFGFDVLWIPDYNCRMNDEELLNLANKEDRILVTNDKDFGEIIFLQKKVSAGIILIRVKGQNIGKKIRSLKKLLKYYVDRISGNFVVISDKRIRIRPLEPK